MSSEPPGKSPDRASDETGPAPKKSSGAARRADVLPPGTILRDEYRVESVLGTGSFGVTYRAVDRHLRAAVAIKEYFPRQLAMRAGSTLTVRARSSDATGGFEEGLQRFMEEGRTIARFDHPNVVDVRSYFEENGTGYLVMNYYEGASLNEYLSQKGGTLSEEEAILLMEDVLSGLSAIHEEGVLHRDVGPKNIYRKESGDAILIDFGAAREAVGARSQDLSTVLTPGYAPIEQYGGGRQGPWTDVYACAATLYRCLTGEKPPEATRRVQEDPLPPTGEICPGASRQVAIAIRKGLALYPERRPQSAEEFRSLLGGDPVEETEGQTVRATRRGTQIAGEAGLEQGELPASKEAAEEALSEEAPEGSPAETEATLSPEESDQPIWRRSLGPLALGAAIAASIGGALLFGDAGPLQVFAYVGTWIATAGGTVLLFREGEKAMSPEARAAVSDWLLKEDFTERASGWPATFISLFDSVFTENHLSWTCFWRSAVVSVVLLSGMYISFAGIGLISVSNAFSTFSEYTAKIEGIPQWYLTASYILSFFPAMIMVDYISLFETRKTTYLIYSLTPVFYPVVLILDIFFTVSIFMLLKNVFFMLSIITLESLYYVLFEPSFYYEEIDSISEVILPFFVAPKNVLLSEAGLLYSDGLTGLINIHFPGSGEAVRLIQAPQLYSTYFTSVWLWLYVGAGSLLNFAYPVISGIDWIKRHLDVKTSPVHSLGLLLGTLITIAFALGSPFAL